MNNQRTEDDNDKAEAPENDAIASPGLGKMHAQDKTEKRLPEKHEPVARIIPDVDESDAGH